MNKMMEMTNADAGTLYVVEDEKLCFKIMKTVSLGIHKSARDDTEMPPVLLNEDNIQSISAYAALKNVRYKNI